MKAIMQKLKNITFFVAYVKRRLLRQTESVNCLHSWW